MKVLDPADRATDREDNQYYPVMNPETGMMTCSCGNELVKLEEGMYRCGAGWPMYRIEEGDVIKDKWGNLLLRIKEH